MLEDWIGGKVAYFAQFRQYSNSPLVDAFVASIETRKLFVDRPLMCVWEIRGSRYQRETAGRAGPEPAVTSDRWKERTPARIAAL